jgi:hypothetical protein
MAALLRLLFRQKPVSRKISLLPVALKSTSRRRGLDIPNVNKDRGDIPRKPTKQGVKDDQIFLFGHEAAAASRWSTTLVEMRNCALVS